MELILQTNPLVEEKSSLPSTTTWLNNPYLALATSENTRKAYRSDIRHYENAGGRLPATPEMVVTYLQNYANQLNPRTLNRRLIALKHWHTYQGFTDPTLHPVIKKTMLGILRQHGSPKQKARPLLPDELARIHHYLMTEDTLSAVRDDALLQIGFFGALRRSELVAIQHEHIQWETAGIKILLPTSKTDQIHDGQFCIIPYGNLTLCPLQSLKKWLEISEIKNGPIFRRISSAGTVGTSSLTPLSVNHILKKCAGKIGMSDCKNLSGHSLRRGLATSAAQAGAPLQVIMQSCRWKQTNTAMEYIEASERFSDNAAINVLQKLVKGSFIP